MHILDTTPSLSRGNHHSDGEKRGDFEFCFYVPSPLHPAALERAQELNVDLIHPSDERSKRWWECELRRVEGLGRNSCLRFMYICSLPWLTSCRPGKGDLTIPRRDRT